MFPFNKRQLLLLLIAFQLISCQQKRVATPMTLTNETLIPNPQFLKGTGSSFLLSEKTQINYNATSDDLTTVSNYLAETLRPATGFDLLVKPINKEPQTSAIYLKLTTNDSIKGDEGYKLYITEDRLQIEANKPVGIFRGIQTVQQLLPASIVLKKKQDTIWEIPTGTIIDYPEYEHRGAMLDVARHFFEVDDVKKFIDHLVTYKMNVLHLHLTDDQGWRIEIKSWPNLTTHGGSTEVGGTEGGFFTQEDYKEIVTYAAERHILVIPEIDMPGHTNAALASYAELNCDGKVTDLYTGMKVGFSSLCTDKEITYQFVDDVIRELAALTPGPYIHIGGDESHATKKDEYRYFINRVQKIVNDHGKQLIGWDDVSAGTLEKSSVAQFWAREHNALEAIAQGAKIIMSPAKKAYLDMKYDSITPIGLKWAGFIEVDDGYNWSLEAYVKGISKEHRC